MTDELNDSKQSFVVKNHTDMNGKFMIKIGFIILITLNSYSNDSKQSKTVQ